MPDDVDPTTEELRVEQLRRERALRQEAERLPADDDTGEQAVARADKAKYLREKLEERARAERAASSKED
jgi:hypothetical protein